MAKISAKNLKVSQINDDDNFYKVSPAVVAEWLEE